MIPIVEPEFTFLRPGAPSHNTMTDEKLKRRILAEAARMISTRRETDYYQAIIKSTRRLCRSWLKPFELPTELELRAELKRMSDLFQSRPPGPADEISSQDSFSDATWEPHDVADGSDQDHFVAGDAPDLDANRFHVYRSLLIPLETVMQDPDYHPEGDLLYHLLQCYVQAKKKLPYDEEFQLAALLHDVGTGIDKHRHVEAGLKALEGQITSRTAWLIEHHMEVYQIRDRTIGHRAHQRLKSSPDYEDLLLLGACDRESRVCGAVVPDLDDALAEIRDLSRLNES